jgi:1-deoxy-D-xylulose-5-phosphate synthase
MPNGTGLDLFRPHHPKRYFDVGIAEEHAVIFCGGHGDQGLQAVLRHLLDIPAARLRSLCMTSACRSCRWSSAWTAADLSGDDGPTHHGLFDISYLRGIPNIVHMVPKDEDELADMMYTAMLHPGPRDPLSARRGAGRGRRPQPQALPVGKAEVIEDGSDVAILGLGRCCRWPGTGRALRARGISAAVINPRFVKPLDREMLARVCAARGRFVTFEDHVLDGRLWLGGAGER